MIIQDPLINLTCEFAPCDESLVCLYLKYQGKLIGKFGIADHEPKFYNNPVQNAFDLWQKGIPILLISTHDKAFKSQNYFWNKNDLKIQELKILASYIDEVPMEKLFTFLEIT